MVNSKEQARQLITEVKLKLMNLPVFEEKVDTVKALLDLEWSLRELETVQEDDIYDDEMRMGIENPWSD